MPVRNPDSRQCCPDDPKYELLADILKDKPSKVAALGLGEARPHELVINFAETVPGYHQSDIDTCVGTECAASLSILLTPFPPFFPTPRNLRSSYTVEWTQATEHVMNPDYIRTKALMHPVDPDAPVPSEVTRLTEVLEDSPGLTTRYQAGIVWRPEGFIIPGLHPDTDYEVRVNAHNVAGDGPWSARVLMRTSTTVPAIPGMPRVLKSTKTSLTVAWLPVPYENGKDLVGYEFQRLMCSHVAKDYAEAEGGGVIWRAKDAADGDANGAIDWEAVPFKTWMRFVSRPIPYVL